ncbi:MAG: DUF1214 domain-containing protein [Pseudomonadota bacterium]
MSQDLIKHAPKLPALPSNLRTFMRALMRRLARIAGSLAFIAIAIAAGATSGWYAIHIGLPFNTDRDGPWTTWTFAGTLQDDPYTRARFSTLDALTVAGDRIYRFEARTDSEGRRLHSSCVYEITSAPLNAAWWSMGVFDARGRLVENASERFAFNHGDVARDGRGAFSIVLSRDARPGNWLPTGAAGRMVVLFEAVEPDDDDINAAEGFQMPPIRRVSC